MEMGIKMNNGDGNIKKGKFLFDLLYVGIILYACARLSFGASRLVDFVFADESVSLFYGLGFKAGHLFTDGFVYHLWYKLFSFFVPDPVALYSFNYAVLVSLNGVLMYILLRKMRRGYFFSGLFSILWVISSVNIFTWPFITRFAGSIILLTLILVLSVRTHRAKFFFLLGGLTILVYVRPEFILSFLLFAAIALVVLGIRYIRSSRKVFAAAFLITLILALFVFVIKNPSAGDRSAWAFGQHYALGLKQQGEKDIDPWGEGVWQKVMKEKFNTDQSAIKAFFNNPSAMLAHVGRNVKMVPFKTLYAHYPFTLTSFSKSLQYFIKWVIIGLYLLAMLMFGKKLFKGFKEKKLLNSFNIDDRLFYLAWVILILPPLISAVLIYPRDHYILVLFLLLYIFLLKHLPSMRFDGFKKYTTIFSPILLLAVVIIIPWRVSASIGLLPGTPLKCCSTLSMMEQIKEIGVRAKVNLLALGMKEMRKNTLFEKYMSADSPYPYTLYRLNTLPAESFLVEKDINMILVDEKELLKKHPDAGPSVKEFIANWTRTGWIKYEMTCRRYLLVKKDILQE
jgi:hypothetical protein